MASLETKVLEGRAALASVQGEREAIAKELAAAREASARVGELKAEKVEANAREESLRTEMKTIKNALQVNGTS